MISFEEARECILEKVPQLQHERVFLSEALNRVLAEDVHAHRDQPPWDNTAVDGFAVQAEDTKGASEGSPKVLSVVETVPAGKMPTISISAGTAARIMTGAPMPDGADAVVMVEDAEQSGDKVEIRLAVETGDNVRLKGEDVTAGDVVLAQGTTLKAAHIGMLASLRRSQVRVSRKPVVGILSTGDEIAELDEPMSVETIPNVNSHAIAAQVVEAGGTPLLLGIAKDTPEAVRDGIREGLSTDVLIISGGVSMGDFDFVKDVMSELGGGLDFWKVKIKPARPLAFGTISDVPVFGLPGNPVSSMVSFELFVRPFLRSAMKHQRIERPVIQAQLSETVRKKPGRRFFLRGVLEKTPNGLTCRTTGPQGSGMLTSMVLADGLIDLPEEMDGPVEKGTTVNVLLL